MTDRNNNDLGSTGRSDEEVNPDLGVDEDSGMSGSSRSDSDLGSGSDESTSGDSSQGDESESGYGDSGSSRSSGVGEDNGPSNR